MVKVLQYDLGLIRGLYYEDGTDLRTILDDKSVIDMCDLLKEKGVLFVYVEHGDNA